MVARCWEAFASRETDETTVMDPTGEPDATRSTGRMPPQAPPPTSEPPRPPAEGPHRRRPVQVVSTEQRVFDPVAWVGWPVGGALIVWGLVALARLGFSSFELFAGTEVAGLGVSRLMALLAIAFGAMVWAAVAGPVNRFAVRVQGAIAIVAGLVFTIEPGAFAPYLATTSTVGATLAGLGVLLAGVSLAHPFTIER